MENRVESQQLVQRSVPTKALVFFVCLANNVYSNTVPDPVKQDFLKEMRFSFHISKQITHLLLLFLLLIL